MNVRYQVRDLERITRDVTSKISEKLESVGFFFRIFSRVKTNDSTLSKVNYKGSEYYDGVNKKIRDVIGIRVILYFSDDLDIVYSILTKAFQLVEETIDKNEETKFAPTRINLVFKIPEELVPEFRSLITGNIIDSTFELQLRTILSEGWHEIDHDLRYKCSDDWNLSTDLSRSFNGILASLETSEYSILRLFEQLSYRHYKAKDLSAILRTKLRIRLSSATLSAYIIEMIDDEFIREVYKTDRLDVLNSLYESNIILPLTLDNLLFFINIIFIGNKEILKSTPQLMLDDTLNINKKWN